MQTIYQYKGELRSPDKLLIYYLNYGAKTTEQTTLYHMTMWPRDQWPPCFGSVYFKNYIKLFFCSISTSK